MTYHEAFAAAAYKLQANPYWGVGSIRQAKMMTVQFLKDTYFGRFISKPETGDVDEVIDRALRIADIRDRRRNPWLFEEHQPFLKVMMEEAAKSDELRSRVELSSLNLFDKKDYLS